uniref:Uncharacterized protein n=1 Tax=Cacopsylla melanoneura TaxID=428564 RepID=A0A8D8QY26_9HEMI
MKLFLILGIYSTTLLLPLPVSGEMGEHLYLQLLKKLYKSFELLVIKMDMFKIMQMTKDVRSYHAYKCLQHNFTGSKDNIWVGTGADDPIERRKRLDGLMAGVEAREYYTEFPRLYECHDQWMSIKRMKSSHSPVRRLRRWNICQEAIEHAKAQARRIPELNLTQAYNLMHDMSRVSIPRLWTCRNKSTRPWLYGLEKLSKRQLPQTTTPYRIARRKLTIHLLFCYTGVFRKYKPVRYPGFPDPVFGNATRGTYHIRSWNSTGIHRRKLFRITPTILKPKWPWPSPGQTPPTWDPPTKSTPRRDQSVSPRFRKDGRIQSTTHNMEKWGVQFNMTLFDEIRKQNCFY